MGGSVGIPVLFEYKDKGILELKEKVTIYSRNGGSFRTYEFDPKSGSLEQSYACIPDSETSSEQSYLSELILISECQKTGNVIRVPGMELTGWVAQEVLRVHLENYHARPGAHSVKPSP